MKWSSEKQPMILLVFVMLSLLGMLSSCGKDDNNNTAPPPNPYSPPPVPPIDPGQVQYLNQVRAFVANDQFYKTYATIRFNYYRYERNVTTPEPDECEIFGIEFTCYDYTNYNYSDIIGEFTNVETAYGNNSMTHILGASRAVTRTNLTNILNSAISVTPYNSYYTGGFYSTQGVFQVQLNTNEYYLLNFNLPLGANPVGYYNYSTGQGYTLMDYRIDSPFYY